MFSALALAIRQLPEPEMRRPLFLSILWSLTTLVVLWILVGWAVAHGLAGIAWAQWLAGLFGALAVPLVSWILFPSVVFLVLGFFSDAIILAVERRYYPYLPPAPGTPMLTALIAGLRLMVAGIVINLVALALVYWWAAWIPGLNAVVFGLVNGYLVGRQYFETVAYRRVVPGEADTVWRDHRMEFILTGAAVAALSLVPLVNLVAPMVAVAATVHLFERFRQSFAVLARA
jgi:CysZ protein